MPTRLIDGDALWTSIKMRKVPLKFRAEYANLIPLAEADGTFMADTRSVWSRVYSCNREDITVEMVEEILNAFENAGMLTRKTDESGRVWGHLNGIENRLPPENIRGRYKSGNSNLFNDIEEISRQSRLDHDKIMTGREGIGLDKERIGLEGGSAADGGHDSF